MTSHNLLNSYIKNKTFSSEENDLIGEMLEKLKRIEGRHRKINDLSSKINEKLNSENFDIDEMRGIAKRIMIKEYGLREDFEPVLRGTSSAHGIHDKNLMSVDEQELEDLVKLNYDDMWRIEEICEKKIKELKFRTKGVRTTRNKLIVHPGTQPDSNVTRDTFVVTSNGPILKGSRRTDQINQWKGYGDYNKEYIEFIEKLSEAMSRSVHHK